MKRSRIIGVGILLAVGAVGYLYWKNRKQPMQLAVNDLSSQSSSATTTKPINVAEQMVQERLRQIEEWKKRRDRLAAQKDNSGGSNNAPPAYFESAVIDPETGAPVGSGTRGAIFV